MYRSFAFNATQSTPTPLRPPRRRIKHCAALHAWEAHPETGVSGDVHRTVDNHEVNELDSTGDRNINSNGHGNENGVHTSNLKTEVRTLPNHQLSAFENEDMSSPHLHGFVPVNRDAIEATPSKENNDQWLANFGIDISLLRIVDEQFGSVLKAQNSAPDETLTAMKVWPENAKSDSNLRPQISTPVTPRAFNKITRLSLLSTPPVRRTPFCNNSTPLESRIPRVPRTPRARTKDENVQIKLKAALLVNESKLVSLPGESYSPQTQIPRMPRRDNNNGNICITEKPALPISKFENLSSPNGAKSAESQIPPVSHDQDENLSINSELGLPNSQSEALSSRHALETAQTRIPRVSRRSDENKCIKPGPGSPIKQPEPISSRSVLDSPQMQTPRASPRLHSSGEPLVSVETTSITQEIGSSKTRQRKRSSTRGLSREVRKLQSGLSNPDEVAGSEVLLTPVRSSRKQRSTLGTETVMTPVRRSLRLSRRQTPGINSPALHDSPATSLTPSSTNLTRPQGMKDHGPNYAFTPNEHL